MPKAGGDQTRLIFHLSYNFSGEESGKSVNYHTPKNLCSMKYYDLDHAVENYLRIRESEQRRQDNCSSYRPVVVRAGKTDIKSAFRVAPLKRSSWPWLIMMAEHPITKKTVFFVDKCLPFGVSISCSHFQ